MVVGAYLLWNQPVSKLFMLQDNNFRERPLVFPVVGVSQSVFFYVSCFKQSVCEKIG